MRFHLANGMVSMVGNVVLMRLLVADVIAIACCSMVNFALSHMWAFAVRGQEAECRT